MLVFAAFMSFISLLNGKHRVIWGAFTIGCLLFLGHTVQPLYALYGRGSFNFFDAFFYPTASSLLVVAILSIRRLVEDLEGKNLFLERVARYDCLTGALSRLETESRALIEIERACRFGQPLAVMEIDLDFFKAINDAHGHHVGDEVLRGVVQNIKGTLRKIDTVGRYGGEEFLVLLPDTDTDEALLVAQRLCKAVAMDQHLTTQAHPIHTTISIGVVVFNPHILKVHDTSVFMNTLFNEADAAMYNAKRNGRNGVCHHNLLDTHPKAGFSIQMTSRETC